MIPDWRAGNPYQQQMADALQSQGVNVLFPRGYHRGLPIWRSLRRVEEKVDIVHLHWHEAYIRSNTRVGEWRYAVKLILDLLLVKASGAKLVWTVHNEVPHDSPRPGYFRKLQYAISWLADSIIVHSSSAWEEIAKHVRRGKNADIIPHPHYRDVYGDVISKSDARRRLGLPEQGIEFLFFGVIRPYKGVEDLLEAWRKVRPSAGARLLIVGSPGPKIYEARIRELAAGQDNVQLIFDFVPDSAVRDYVCSADCMVLPFRKILTSGSLTLALSYGVPVIAPDVAFIREEVNQYGGELFQLHDVDSLASAIGQVISKTGETGGHPRLSARAMSWTDLATQTARVYSRVLRGQSPATASLPHFTD